MKSARDCRATDLVQLPKLENDAARSLARSMIAAAAGATLSDGATEALEELHSALKAVEEAASSMATDAAVDMPTVHMAGARVDAVWSATYSWLTGWVQLPGAKQATVAETLREHLFPPGRDRGRSRKTIEQRAEALAALAGIDAEELTATFSVLGGAAFLEKLRSSRAAYGEAFNVKRPVNPEQRSRLQYLLFRLTDALRDYVLQVSAMARKSDPLSEALTVRLLGPITMLASTPAATGGGERD